MITMADRTQSFLASGWQRVFRDPRERQVLTPHVAGARSRLRAARRFTLSNDFVEAAVRAATTEDMRVLFGRVILARLPFQNVWIEFDQQYRTEIQMQLGTAAVEPAEDRGMIGYLMSHLGTNDVDWYASPFIGGREEGDEVILGLVSQVLGDSKMMELLMQNEGPTKAVAPFYSSGWGLAKHPDGDDEEFAALQHKCMLKGHSPPEIALINPLMDMYRADETRTGRESERGSILTKGYSDHAMASRGDLRFLIAVLALLNCTPVTYKHTPAAGRFTHRLKTMNYLDSHTVSLSIGATKTMRILDRTARSAERHARRRHEVRGTWRVVAYKTPGTGCRHIPVDGTLDGDYATCGQCQQRIKWVKDHQRGDAGLGFVQKDYEVDW